MAHFRGIPYVAPPVGPRRWQAPAPVEPWKGTLKCTKFGPYAYQRAAGFEVFFAKLVDGLGLNAVRKKTLATAIKVAKVEQSEDCLYLNVWAPRRSAADGCR